jgi:hypothetical protein
MAFNEGAEKALNLLIQQPEVGPKMISISGHTEDTVLELQLVIRRK